MSSVYDMKQRESTTEPWGTLQSTGQLDVYLPASVRGWVETVRYELNQLRAAESMLAQKGISGDLEPYYNKT